jgi:hypothetical protein
MMQSRYVAVELELLVVNWTIKKFQFYLKGWEGFTVLSDHLGLVGLKRKDLTDVENPRLESLLQDLHGYNFTIS